jgi:hypothetical protein
MSSPGSSRSASPSTPPQDAGSVGRSSSGKRLEPMAFMESLGPSASHPLLQPSESPEGASTVNGPSSPASSQYMVSYKPRQRPNSVSSNAPQPPQPTLPSRASTSTSTAVSAPSLSVPLATKPTSPQGETSQATSRLQLQSLQAAVQALGLDNDAAGWILLLKLLSVAADHSRSEEWEALFADISRNRVWLLFSPRMRRALTTCLVRSHFFYHGSPFLPRASTLVS